MTCEAETLPNDVLTVLSHLYPVAELLYCLYCYFSITVGGWYKEAIAKILELLDHVKSTRPDFSVIDDTKFGLLNLFTFLLVCFCISFSFGFHLFDFFLTQTRGGFDTRCV